MEIRITDDGSRQEIEQIHALLRAYNRSRRESAESVPIGVFYDGDKLAGLTGETFGNWLCIKYLYVSEELRGRGIGTEIMRAAESEARARGCRYAFVDTFSFQAPGFYEKLGYRQVFALEQYPYTSARYYYTKEL